jgi:hypothetical protein
VAASGGELERTAAALLAAHVGEIRPRRHLVVDVRRFGGLQVLFAAEVGDGLRKVMYRHGLHAGETCLRRRLRGAEDSSQSLAAGALGERDRPGDGTNAPVERKLSDHRMVAKRLERQLT